MQTLAIAGLGKAEIGIWISAILTLMVFSFLYKDNPFYKFAEHLFAGVSIGYLVGTNYQPVICPKVVSPLTQLFVRFGSESSQKAFIDFWGTSGKHRFFGCSMEGLQSGAFQAHHLSALIVLIPLLIGLCTLAPFIAPKRAWLTALPFAYIIGWGAGITIPANIQASILAQMEGTVYPFYAFRAGDISFVTLLSSILVFIGLLATLSYFFFSAEHKGLLNYSSKLGIYFVMIGFGAAFGLTVMARVSLLIVRFDYLYYTWLEVGKWFAAAPK